MAPPTPASDWRLGMSRGCSAHIALAPGKLPPALDAPTQGRASILVVRYSVTAPPWECAVLPVCGYLQQALRVQEKRRTLVPGRAGVVRRFLWGLGAPKPLPGRSGVLFDWSFTAGLCATVSPTGPVLPHKQPAVLLGRLAGVLLSRASPGSRKRLPVAATFFFLLRKRKVIPAGPRQGWARAPSPLHAMGPPLTWPCPPGLQRRGKEEEKHKCRSNRPRRGQGTQSITFNPASRRTAGAGELASPRRCPAAAHSPQKKTSEEVFYFFNPKTNPTGALRAQEKQHHADRSCNRRDSRRRQ